ncbi:unnamed protein product [Lathyrus sativus]|nr:unnamed protein product [Lathyrus sativus]
MALISSFFYCFGLSSNLSSQVSNYDEKSSQTKVSSSEKPKRKEKSKGAPIIVSYFPVNSNLSRL